MKKIPEGFHTVTPSLVLNDAAKAIKLYEKALGAQELYRMEHPGMPGKIMHACILVGSSRIFLSDVMPGSGCSTPSTSNFYVYLEDVDSAHKRAREAKIGEELMPLQDMFWGDRTCAFRDSFGISWTLATHVKDVSPEEMEKGAKQFAMKAA